jgi:hypothetical protein
MTAAVVLLLLAAAAVLGQVSVMQVQVGTETYIAVRINATQQYGANFTALAYANASGVYVAANPPTQRIACYWSDQWHNGTGVVRIPDPSARPVCWFAGFPYPVAVVPMREEIPPFPLGQYLWLVGIVPIVSAVMWRRIEVAGIVAIATAIINAWAYPMFGYSQNQAVAVSMVLLAIGGLLILASRAGE